MTLESQDLSCFSFQKPCDFLHLVKIVPNEPSMWNLSWQRHPGLADVWEWGASWGDEPPVQPAGHHAGRLLHLRPDAVPHLGDLPGGATPQEERICLDEDPLSCGSCHQVSRDGAFSWKVFSPFCFSYSLMCVMMFGGMTLILDHPLLCTAMGYLCHYFFLARYLQQILTV